MSPRLTCLAAITLVALATSALTDLFAGEGAYDPTKDVMARIAKMKVGKRDWPMWAGSSLRNNTPGGKNIPTTWDIDSGQNIRFESKLGSQTYGNPVVANGKVYVGTNNGAGYLPRYSDRVDLGCLICFDEQDGTFLWQHSSEKLSTGRVHDWPLQGICCAPYVDGDRLWFVTSRGEVVCADTEGFYDNEDDGPVRNQSARLFKVSASQAVGLDDGELSDTVVGDFAKAGVLLPQTLNLKTVKPGKAWSLTAKIDGKERQFRLAVAGPNLSAFKTITTDDKHEADVVWVFDMMKKLGSSQHNMCSCSITGFGDILFVQTGNGVDATHLNIPAPNAASFFAMNRNTGKVLWTDKSPGTNILHGQWSAPAVAVLGGVPQVLMPGGDGWLYSFRADEGKDGKPELLWKFDCNPKDSVWILGGRGTRNNLIATPCVYDGLVYIGVGQDPEHGEGVGHLWCIDPTKRGDVSPKLVVNKDDPTKIVPPRRLQSALPDEGDKVIANPNSAVVWHFSAMDANGDKTIDFEEEMHRTCGTCTIKDDILYIADFSGLFRCHDAKTGKPLWVHDMLAASWGSPLIVDGHVYIGDEDGDVTIVEHGRELEIVNEINMANSVFTTPVVANDTLFISNRTALFAIDAQAQRPAGAGGEDR